MSKYLFGFALVTLFLGGMSTYTVAQNDPFSGSDNQKTAGPFEKTPSIQQSDETTLAAQTSTKSADELIREVLEQKVDLNYEDTPFVEIMDELSQVYGINVMLDQSAVDDSLSEDDLVTFKASNIKLKAALRVLLDQFNTTYLVKNEVLLLISKDVAKNPEFLTRRIINCQVLLEKIAAVDPRNQNTISGVYRIGEAVSGGFGGPPAGGGGVFSLVPGDKIDGLIDEKGQIDKEKQANTWFIVKRGFNPGMDLMDTIKTSIAPDDWDDTNGEGSITLVGGCLVVQQTEQVVEEIQNLLVELSNSMDQE